MFRRVAVRFKFIFFIDEKCILEKLGKWESLFWRKKFENASVEREVFSLWTWIREILVDFLGNAGILNPIETWVSSFTNSSPSQSLSPQGKAVPSFNIHSFSFFSHYHQVFLPPNYFYTFLHICGSDEIISDKNNKHPNYLLVYLSYTLKRAPTTGD